MASEPDHTLVEALGINEQQWQQSWHNSERMVRINTPDGSYWLKKAAPARGLFRYHALNIFSRLMRLPLLKAVPQPGGNQAITNEVMRLQALKSKGIQVPTLLAHGDNWLLIADAGQSIVRTMKLSTTAQSTRQQLFKSCLTAIRALHDQQQYLSQGFIRNMLIDKASDQVVFIDFEDDPLQVMTLAEAQARDVLLLINSTARFFINDQNWFEQAITEFLDQHDSNMIQALTSTAQHLQWVTRIPFQSLLGHDYQKLKVGILALKHLGEG